MDPVCEESRDSAAKATGDVSMQWCSTVWGAKFLTLKAVAFRNKMRTNALQNNWIDFWVKYVHVYKPRHNTKAFPLTFMDDFRECYEIESDPCNYFKTKVYTNSKQDTMSNGSIFFRSSLCKTGQLTG